MALEVGSMLIKAKFDTGNIMTGLSGMVGKLKESTLTAKSATTEFMRMKGTLIGLAAAAGLSAGVLLGMLTNAVMQSPFLAAALEKLKNEFMLFGNAIAKHVAPILEKVVDLIRWLRQKFEALPEPMQSIIVKGIILSGVILGLVGILGTFILALGLVKTSLVTLGLTGVITKLAALKATILGSTAVGLLFSIALGLLAGGLAVIVLDKLGVIDWFSDLGRKIGEVNAILRDVLLTIALFTRATEGAGVIDIIRGDFDFTMMKESKAAAEAAKGRLMAGTSYQYAYGETMKSGEPKPGIENQSNTYNIDLSALQGNFEDPETQRRLTELISATMAEQQQSLNV